jgi:hypothetical protein
MEAIAIAHELSFLEGIAFALEGLATVALATNSTLQAVHLWACAEILREQGGAAMSPAHRRRYDGEVESAKTQLSAGAFDKAWTNGLAMTLDEAVRYALQGSISSPGSTA